MGIDFKALEETVKQRFGGDALRWTDFRGQHCLHVKRDRILQLMGFLRDDPATKFNMLRDVTCVDGMKLPEKMEEEYPERFAVVYHLYSMEHNDGLRVKAYVPEDPCEIDSVSGLWSAANWGEREAFDMFGVDFKGHPDLRRILMPAEFEGHPLRKDYPLKGRGERDNFPKYTEIPEA